MRDLEQKSYVITGANSGIGRVTARELARRGARVVLACRSRDKTLPAIEEIKAAAGHDRVEFVQLDLADPASVRDCARQLLEWNMPVHGLINNAGLAGQRGLTRDGFELAFGTNHLGHYLLTRLLLSRIVGSAPARIVNVSSASHLSARGIDWDALRRPTATVTGLREYGVSKLCNVLFTRELVRRLAGTQVTVYTLNPGRVATDVWRRIPGPLSWLFKKLMLTPEQGAFSTIRCAADPALDKETGCYYDSKGRPRPGNPLADDTELARALWQRSAEWTGLPADPGSL